MLKSIVMVEDVTYCVTNVLYGFLSFLAKEGNAGSSPEEAFLSQYVDIALHGCATEEFSLYRPDNESEEGQKEAAVPSSRYP